MRLVAAFVMVTVAFGTAPPLLSFTVPDMRPKTVCALTPAALNTTTQITNAAKTEVRLTKKDFEPDLLGLNIASPPQTIQTLGQHRNARRPALRLPMIY